MKNTSRVISRFSFTFSLSLLVLSLSGPDSLYSEEKITALARTGQIVSKVAKKLAEPITNPRAAVSTWFEFNPDIESGKKRNYNILPLFVSSPERGQGFGVKYAQESVGQKKDVLELQALHTVKNRSSYNIHYKFSPQVIDMKFEASYENYDKYYYGIGNNAKESDKSDYNPQIVSIQLPVYYGITDHISAGIKLNYENWKIINHDSGGILPSDMAYIKGKEQTRIMTTGLLLRWDNRDSLRQHSSGAFLQSGVEYSKKLLGSEADFTRTTLDARSYHSIFGQKDHTFAYRLFMDYKSGDVPFHHLPELGGSYFNRGLIEGRYRDTLSIAGNWEYRLNIYKRLHWAFFVDGGNVFNEYRTASFKRTKFTGGTGMRYYVPPGNLLLARVDAGISREGILVYLNFDHPF